MAFDGHTVVGFEGTISSAPQATETKGVWRVSVAVMAGGETTQIPVEARYDGPLLEGDRVAAVGSLAMREGALIVAVEALRLLAGNPRPQVNVATVNAKNGDTGKDTPPEETLVAARAASAAVTEPTAASNPDVPSAAPARTGPVVATTGAAQLRFGQGSGVRMGFGGVVMPSRPASAVARTPTAAPASAAKPATVASATRPTVGRPVRGGLSLVESHGEPPSDASTASGGAARAHKAHQTDAIDDEIPF